MPNTQLIWRKEWRLCRNKPKEFYSDGYFFSGVEGILPGAELTGSGNEWAEKSPRHRCNTPRFSVRNVLFCSP